VNILNSIGQLTLGSPPTWRLGEGQTTPHRKKKSSLSRNVTQGLGGALVNTVMNLRLPLKVGSFTTS